VNRGGTVSGLGPQQLQEIAKWDQPGPAARPAAGRYGYFESLADTCFRTLDDGTKVFYPHGPFGRRGYVVETSRDEDALRRRVKNGSALMIVASPFLASFYGVFLRDTGVTRLLLLMAGLYVANWIVTEVQFWPLVRRLKRADAANLPIAAWRRMGRTMHPGWLILGGAFLLCLAVAGFLLHVLERQPAGLVIGFLSILVAAPYVIALRSWWRHRAGGRPPAT
jgi:hypothetical protein